MCVRVRVRVRVRVLVRVRVRVRVCVCVCVRMCVCVCVCVFLECDGQETCSGTNHQFHYTSGEGELSYTQHTNSFVSLSSSQERYLASLMPLKRDVSPWRVSQWLYSFSWRGYVSDQLTFPPVCIYFLWDPHGPGGARVLYANVVSLLPSTA